MLPKSFRMDRKFVEETVKEGKFFNSPSFSYRVNVKNVGLNGKFAVTTSKKSFPLAVERNKMRRRVYEALRALLGNRKISSKSIISVKKQAKNLTQKEIIEELSKNLF